VEVAKSATGEGGREYSDATKTRLRGPAAEVLVSGYSQYVHVLQIRRDFPDSNKEASLEGKKKGFLTRGTPEAVRAAPANLAITQP